MADQRTLRRASHGIAPLYSRPLSIGVDPAGIGGVMDLWDLTYRQARIRADTRAAAGRYDHRLEDQELKGTEALIASFGDHTLTLTTTEAT